MASKFARQLWTWRVDKTPKVCYPRSQGLRLKRLNEMTFIPIIPSLYPRLYPHNPKNTTIRFGRQFAQQLEKFWPMDLSQKIKLLVLDLTRHAVLFWLDRWVFSPCIGWRGGSFHLSHVVDCALFSIWCCCWFYLEKWLFLS